MEGDYAVGAHLPWASPYYGVVETGKKEKYRKDDETRIEKCLNCNFPVCFDCYGVKETKYDRRELFGMILAGKRTDLICKALGISERTVRLAKEEMSKAW